FAIASPPGRYLQYKLTWKSGGERATSSAEQTVTVGRVDVTYLPRNSGPKIGSVSTKAGALLSGRQSVSVPGSHPDGDNLLLSVEMSSDDAHSWKALAADLRSTRPKSAGTKAAEAEGSASKEATPEAKKQKTDEQTDKETESSGKDVLQGGVQQDAEKGGNDSKDKGE